MLSIAMRAPARGYFTGTFPAPLDTPFVLRGLRGEIAVRTEVLGDHNAVYRVWARGDALVPLWTNRAEGTHVVALRLQEHDADVRFALHPAVTPYRVTPTVHDASDSSQVFVTVVRFSERASEQLWELEFRDGNDVLLVWATVPSNSAVVDYQAIATTLDRRESRHHWRLAFGGAVVPVRHGRARVDADEAHVVSLVTSSDSGCVSKVHRWRVACSLPDRVADPTSDVEGDVHPWLDATAEEIASADLGPFRGIPEAWSEDWLGVPLSTDGTSDLVDAALEAWSDPARVDAALEAWSDPARVSGWPGEPRPNPNQGGTDPAFGSTFTAPFLEHGLGAPDPTTISAFLRAADAWCEHPIFYFEPGTVLPLEPPPAHPELTTHKLQPWEGRIDWTWTGVPVGIGVLFGNHPFDPQHRAFMLLVALYALTGCPALRRILEWIVGAELHDRRGKLDVLGNGREEGRISINTLAISRVIGDPHGAIDAYLSRRLQTELEDRVGKDYTGSIRPLFTNPRGVPFGDRCKTSGTCRYVSPDRIEVPSFEIPPHVGFKMQLRLENGNRTVFELATVRSIPGGMLLGATSDVFASGMDGQTVEVHSIEGAWTPWEEAQDALGKWLFYRRTGSLDALRLAHERASNVALVLVQEDDSFWFPWRVRDTEPKAPRLTPGAENIDFEGRTYGPNSVFAWAAVALRVFLLTSRERGIAFSEIHRRAALALQWLDRTQRPHAVDAAISLRGCWADLIEEVLEATDPE